MAAIRSVSGTHVDHTESRVLFGPESGLIQEYLKGARALENKVQVLSSAQSRQRYPQLRCKEHLVILDSTAGCINAAETRMGLYQFLCAHPQVVVLENHRVEALGSTSDAMHVQCSNARYTADRSSCRWPLDAQSGARIEFETHGSPPRCWILRGSKGISLYPRNSPGSISERARTRFSMACLRMPIP